MHGGNWAISGLMLTYCFKVCTHPCPRHLPQDVAEAGREGRVQGRAGGSWGGGEVRSTAEWPGSGPIVFRVTSLFLSEPPEVCFLPSGCGAAINKSVSGRGQYLVWFPHGEGAEGGDPSLNQQSRGVAHGKLPARAEIKSR